MKFHLYGTSLSGLAVDEYAVTDGNGVAKFEDVLISGDTPYVLEEVDTAIRYVVPASQTAPIEWNKVTNRSFQNILKKFNVTVTKTDAETGTPQGDASLAGAVYGIYKGEELIDTYTTDENGQFTTKYAKYHNAVFVGYDAQGIPRHAHKRGTYTTGDAFKGNVDSCDPRYSFHWIGQSDTVYVFEAPIDMLSFLSFYRQNWKQHSYVALCGVAEHALMRLLTDAPHVNKIALCLDNDKAGVQARERIQKHLAEREYRNVFSLFSNRKDWNEDLQALSKPPPEPAEEQQPVMQMG